MPRSDVFAPPRPDFARAKCLAPSDVLAPPLQGGEDGGARLGEVPDGRLRPGHPLSGQAPLSASSQQKAPIFHRSGSQPEGKPHGCTVSPRLSNDRSNRAALELGDPGSGAAGEPIREAAGFRFGAAQSSRSDQPIFREVGKPCSGRVSLIPDRRSSWPIRTSRSHQARCPARRDSSPPSATLRCTHAGRPSR
jgi:hypothetical protein